MIESPQYELDKIAFSKVILGGGTLIGMISDFNFWSRPLTQDEVDQYTSGCNADFVKKSQPDIVIWAKANVSFRGNHTAIKTISSDLFCQHETDLHIIP